MRVWLKCVLALAAVLVIALGSLPWWLGAALPIVARRAHVAFRAYRLLSYGRFELDGVVYRHGPVVVRIDDVRADTPLVWLVRRWQGKEPPVVARGWSAVVSRSEQPAAVVRPRGMAPLRVALDRIASRLEKWVPEGQADQGAVSWPTGSFRLDRADWNSGRLTFSGLHWKLGSASGRARFMPDGSIHASAEEPADAMDAEADWNADRITGEGSVKGQRFTFRAEYAAQGWLPTEAEARAPSWTATPKTLPVLAFYGPVAGSGLVRWHNGEFELAATADGKPRIKDFPPLHVDVRATGTRAGWSVEALRIHAPSLSLTLERPVRFSYPFRPEFSHAELTVHAALSALPITGVAGTLDARIVVAATPGASGRAAVPTRATASASLKDVSWRGWTADSVTLQADWSRGAVSVSRLDATGPEGSATVSGTYEPHARALRNLVADVRLGPEGLRLLALGGVTAEAATVSLKASGAWPQVSSSGRLAVSGIRLGALRPLEAAARWTGRGGQVTLSGLQVQCDGLRLSAQGRADRTGAVLEAGTIVAPDGVWRFGGPVQIGWKGGLTLAGLTLDGPGAAHIGFDLGGAHAVRVRLARVPVQAFLGVGGWRAPDCLVQSLGFTGDWDGSHLRYDGSFEGTVSAGKASAAVTGSIAGDGGGLRIEALRVADHGAILATASGRLPVQWRRTGPKHLVFDPHGAIALDAATGPLSPFWSAIAKRFGLRLDDPHAHLSLTGSLDDPVGELSAGVRSLGPAPGRLRLRVPPLENLTLVLRATTAGLSLDTLSASLAGQAIQAHGAVPIPSGAWRPLARSPIGLLRRASGELDLAPAPLAPWAALFPKLLSPLGRFGAHVRLSGGSWSGSLWVAGAALRPLGTLGLVQDIDGTVSFQGRSIRIDRLRAEIGGQPINVSGVAEFPAGGKAHYAVSLNGQDVPLIRQAGMIVRANVDLVAETQRTGTVVSGAVAVTDGIVLGDLASLLPSGPAGVPAPPPYFSIDAPPFSTWGLDVRLTAAHTLRVHTAVYTGTQSADFSLVGTLGDPRAIGQVTVDSGEVALPFATLAIRYGAVRLTVADPFVPRVDATATARAYDYDIRLDVRGPVDNPILTFSSSPGLPSDQVLSLVMAGQVPPNAGMPVVAPSPIAGLGAYLGAGLFSGFAGGTGPPRLEISSGQNLSLSGKPTYEIDYRLSPRWWLVGEYDQFDNYDAGVKWRVLNQGGGTP